MPNHVHLVCTPLFINDEVISLALIMQSLKGYTARKANLLLGRQGDFWQHESYDHVVRDAAELDRIVKYVMANRAMAGLEEKWVYCRGM
jgi:REP element-mobilizing transposase RayT